MKLKMKPNSPSQVIDHEATGKMVRFERVLLGLTVTDVAAKAGCDVSHLSMLERGKRSWSNETLSDVDKAIQSLSKNGKAGK